MGEHWDKIDYKPENTALNEVDEDTDPDIQVGIKEKETVVVVPDSTLTSKYSSVIIRGFRSETSVDSILEVLSLQGVAGITEEDVIMNAKSGSVTVENLKPEDCLILVGKMNKKRFLSRNIFVTSVVSASPSKNPATNPEPNPASNVFIVNQQSVPPTPAPDLGNFLTPRPNATGNGNQDIENQFVFGPASPGVKEHVSEIEKKGADSKFSDMTQLDKKRKNEGSPESLEKSRKEKKILKTAKKQERDQKVQILKKTI